MTKREPFRVIEDDGTFDAKREPTLAEDELKAMYRTMQLVRSLDVRMLTLQRQGRIGFYVPSTGQEACQVGSAKALRPEDWVLPAYREPGAALWRGFPLFKLVCQFMGNAEDILLGRQMPNHYGSRDINYVTPSSPVGTQIPHAVGVAWAAKIRGEPVVALVYFGDGASSEGDFHAAMNFAGVFHTPTVFFCQNNQWAISVPFERQTAAETIAQKALAYGFDGVRVDGNDVLAVYAATRDAVERARSGEGPTLIEAVTYRMGPHSSSDDPTRYRSKEEVQRWKERDPILRFRKYLEGKGIWTQEDEDALLAEIDEAIADAVKKAERVAPPALESLFEDVYEEMPPHLKEQMETFLKSGERRRTEEMDEFPL
jgi:pyruvate dehydrogenase E1 component alpha subunit